MYSSVLRCAYSRCLNIKCSCSNHLTEQRSRMVANVLLPVLKAQDYNPTQRFFVFVPKSFHLQEGYRIVIIP